MSELESDATTASHAGRPPGPDGYPLVGCMFDLLRDPFEFLSDAAEYDDVVAYDVGPMNWCLVLHPDHVEQVFLDRDTYEKWTFDAILSAFPTDGILMAEGDRWKRQRELLQQAFRPERLRQFVGHVSETTLERAEAWDDGSIVHLDQFCLRLSLELQAKILFGFGLDDEMPIVRDAVEAFRERINPRNVSTFAPGWLPLPANRRYQRRMGDFEAFAERITDERRTGEYADGADIVSLLLETADDAGYRMSNDEIVDHLVTFLGAGHTPMSYAVTYPLFALTQHLEKQEQLRREALSTFDGGTLDEEQFQDLTYAERVLKEGMRLYPPVPAVYRAATEPTTIGGYQIDQGTIVTASQHLIHRDDRFYDDPLAFAPDRWTDGFEDQLPRFAYFPFGAGPRQCIGMRLAEIVAKTVLSTLVAHSEFELVRGKDLDFRLSSTLDPKTDILVRVHQV